MRLKACDGLVLKSRYKVGEANRWEDIETCVTVECYTAHMPIAVPSITERADYYDLERAARQGFMLPEISAAALEKALVHNPEDLITRARLLGYYSIKKTRSAKLRSAINEARFNHIIWFIENAPDCVFAGDTYLGTSKTTDQEHYSEIVSAWSDAVQNNPQAQTRINFALFLSQHNKSRAITALKELHRDVPSNPWPASILRAIDPKFKSLASRRQAVSTVVNAPLNDSETLTHLLDGAFMPSESVESLRKVLAVRPHDLPARTELIGRLKARAKRANLIGYDPAIVNELSDHLHWLVACAPRSRLWSDMHGQAYEAFPIHELSQLRDAWLAQLESNPTDARIAAAATCFFWYAHERALFNRYLKIARKLSRKDQSTRHLLTYGLPYKRDGWKPVEPKGAIGLLDAVACTSPEPPPSSSPGPYTFQEWARDLKLAKAELTGVYQWVPLSSNKALDQLIPPTSRDCVNRAKILGCYSKEIGLHQYGKAQIPVDEAWQSYERQLRWFIDNLPQSRLLSVCQHHMKGIHSERPSLFAHVQHRLETELSQRSPDLNSLISFAVLFSEFDKDETARINARIEPLSRAWYDRFRLIGGATPQPIDVAGALESHNFMAGKRSTNLSRVAQKLGLTRQSLFGMDIPARTIWSNEFALAINPNDLILRAELMWAYDTFDQFKIYFGGYTPDVLDPLIRHNLWWIANLPDYYTYGASCDLSGDTPRRPDLREHAILLKAVEMQLLAYPKNLKVHLALSHYFPLGCEKESLKYLRKMKKRHPKNRDVTSRIEHKASLVRGRSRRP